MKEKTDKQIIDSFFPQRRQRPLQKAAILEEYDVYCSRLRNAAAVLGLEWNGMFNRGHVIELMKAAYESGRINSGDKGA